MTGATVTVLPMRQRTVSEMGAVAWRPLTLAIFAGWLLVIGSHHEPWLDEAQSWLLARDNDLWPLLAERVRYEGSPGLWHLILWLAIRAGLPFSSFYLVPAVFAVAGAAVVLWRAPFPGPLRIGILASYFFGFQYSILARSYCLDLLLIPLAASFFAARLQRPLRYALVVGLIANANAQGFVAAGVMGCELAWQVWRASRSSQPRRLAAPLLAAGLGLFAMGTAWQPADNGFLATYTRSNPLLMATAYLCNAFIYRINVWSSAPQGNAIFLSVLLTVALQWPVVRLVMAGRNRIMLLGVMSSLLVLAVLVYADRWGSGVVFLFWLFLLWVEWGNHVSVGLRRQLTGVLSLICLMQGVESLRTGVWDIEHVYSPGRQVAAALVAYRESHPDARIAGYSFKSFEVQPWLSGNPYANYHDGASRPSYIVWARKEPWPVKTNLARWQQLLATRPDLIVASRVDFTSKPELLEPLACRMGYRLRQTFPGAAIWHGVVVEDETLYLYERAATPKCNFSGKATG